MTVISHKAFQACVPKKKLLYISQSYLKIIPILTLKILTISIYMCSGILVIFQLVSLVYLLNAFKYQIPVLRNLDILLEVLLKLLDCIISYFFINFSLSCSGFLNFFVVDFTDRVLMTYYL